MSDGVLLLLALAAAVCGMGCLALSLRAHWRQVFADLARTRGTTLGLRVAGAVLLAASFLLCATANPVSMAALVWPMLLTVAAAIVAAGLTLQAQGARRRSARRVGTFEESGLGRSETQLGRLSSSNAPANGS